MSRTQTAPVPTEAEVCRGFDEASELILAYLRSGDG